MRKEYTPDEIAKMREDCAYQWIDQEGSGANLRHSVWFGQTSCHSWSDLPVDGWGECPEDLVIEYWEKNYPEVSDE